MTAIFYPDCRTTSKSGRYTLDACSPHNGTIPHRDGKPATEKEFGFKYREYQKEFRYRLLENANHVVWERLQLQAEDSPHELLVSDDGWSIIRTHGFCPEVIAVSSTGEDIIRVAIVGDERENRRRAPVASPHSVLWSAERLAYTTGGLFWTAHSWPYFMRHEGQNFFVWRTYWGQRLVIDLNEARILSTEEQSTPTIQRAFFDAETHLVTQLLTKLSSKIAEVREWFSKPNSHPLSAMFFRVTAALHLVGVHRLSECLPFLRQWEGLDVPSSCTMSRVIGANWSRESQFFRPIVHHSLKQLGEEPLGFATYHFTNDGDDTKHQFHLPERISDRRERVSQLSREMTAEQVLLLLGSPDHIRGYRLGKEAPYRFREEWNFDFRVADKWVTLKITWEALQMLSIEEMLPSWLETDERESEFLRF